MRDDWPLRDDSDHAKRCHQRWIVRLNRNPDKPEYRDAWYREQCFGCRYFIRLAGALAEDYGACTNAASKFDGRVMFEHDGCDSFEPTGE
jgi:hypothetical protein